MRAWLELLNERHPQVTWITQDGSSEDAADRDSSTDLVQEAT
jgi:hypothetical protein